MKSRMRARWHQVHLWLGLTLGVVGALARAVFLGGTMPPTLMATGLLIWLRKRRQKRAPAFTAYANHGSPRATGR